MANGRCCLDNPPAGLIGCQRHVRASRGSVQPFEVPEESMKRFLPLLLLAAFTLGLVPAKPLILLFDYPAPDLNTNLVFVMHGTTNLVAAQPWPVEAIMAASNFWSNGVWNVPQSNGVATFQMTLAVQPGQHFYYVTASNTFWEAESVPSNVLALDPLPGTVQGLKARKGW